MPPCELGREAKLAALFYREPLGVELHGRGRRCRIPNDITHRLRDAIVVRRDVNGADLAKSDSPNYTQDADVYFHLDLILGLVSTQAKPCSEPHGGFQQP